MEDIKGSYVESRLKELHELGLEIGEMRRDLQKGCYIIYMIIIIIVIYIMVELKCLWGDIVTENQALHTELRKKEELITQIENG